MEWDTSSPRNRQFIYIRDLLYELVARDIKLRYKRSALGIVWTLLNPLAQLLVYHFIFRLVLPLQIPNYASFLFTGLIAWNWFQFSLSQATLAIVDNRELVKRSGFPLAILPIVTVMSHLVHFLIALPVLCIFLAIEGIPITKAVIFLPFVMIVQFIFTLALSYIVATSQVRFHDTQYLLGVALHLCFFLTPIVYDAGVVPPRYALIYWVNPMTHLVKAYRSIIMQGSFPDLLPLLGLLGISMVMLLFTYRYFKWSSRRFADEV